MNRRRFFKLVGAAAGFTVLTPGAQAQAKGHPHEAQAAPAQVSPQKPQALPVRPEAYNFFNPEEAAFVEAAVDRLIPADELGPGGREAGCAYFIDQQLAGAYGAAAKWYMGGPWGESTPQQGYQLPLTPREVYRTGIAAVNRYCQLTYGHSFAQLNPEQQDEVLRGLEAGRIDLVSLGGPPAQTFFNMLLGNTVEGYFSDPVYGGNRNKVGWRLVGFPGVAAAYVSFIENYNQPYEVEPVGIADVAGGVVDLDEHGHPIHRPLAKRR